jgi:hypothetical protein
VLQFTLADPTSEFPSKAALTIDPTQRALIKDQTYAFRNLDGGFFLARVDSVRKAKRTLIDRDGCEIIGKLVAWGPKLH